MSGELVLYSGTPTGSSSDESSSSELSDDASDPSFQNEKYKICQYVHRVIDFSSQYGSDTSISYTAFNIIGRQSKFPEYGDFPETFAMKTYGNWWERAPSAVPEIMPQNWSAVPVHDFIVVEFEEYVIPYSVTVYETFNPGSVINIYAYVEQIKEWFLLWAGAPCRTEERVARKFKPPIKRINYPTKIIRLEFNHSRSSYFSEIDAVVLKGDACFRRAPKVGTLKCIEYEARSHRGFILKRLEQFDVKMSYEETMKNFLVNDLDKFIKDFETENDDSLTLTKIPCEILYKICAYLDLKSLFRVGRTCRKLYEVSTDPMLYRSLNLKPYWNVVNDSMLASLSRRATNLQKLDLSWCGMFDAITVSQFKEFIRRCGGKLIDLRLNSCQFLNASCMEVVCQVCSVLKELSLRNYPVSVLNFHGVRKFVYLERLDLFRTYISQDLLLMMLRNNANLKHLNLGICPPHVSMDDVAAQISETNRKIVSLDMWKSHSLSSAGLHALSVCVHLEEVDFGWCLRTEAFPGDGLKALVSGCTKLKKLFLAAIRGLNDRDLLCVAEYCQPLEQLDLMGVLGLSQEGYYHILRHCTNLKLFDLSFSEPNDILAVALWRDAFGVDIKSFNASNNHNLF